MSTTDRLLTAVRNLTPEQIDALAWIAEHGTSDKQLPRHRGAGVDVITPTDYALARAQQAMRAVQSLLEHGPGASVSPAGIRPAGGGR